MHPQGRTSHKYKNALRRRVTIVNKQGQEVDRKQVKMNTDTDQAE